MTFAAFMSGGLGRGLRVVAGLVLIVLGIRMHTAIGTIVAIAGIVPLAAGAFNWCLAAPLFGGPISGSDIHNRKA